MTPLNSTPQPDERQSGLTLVEMMVAIGVVGMVLTALASVLTGSLRAIVSNEYEATATAFAQQEVERLQATPWEQAGILDSDYDPAAPAASDAPSEWIELLEEGRFEGLELVTVSAPEGSTERPPQVPDLLSAGEDVELSRDDFSVRRYVTWVARAGDLDAPETRRFTVVVSWSALGRERTISASGERTPTQGESPATEYGLRLLNFLRSPDPSLLDEEGNLQSDLTVEVRLSGAVDQGWLRYHTAEAEPICHVEATLTPEELEEFECVEPDEWEIEYELVATSSWATGLDSGVYRVVIPAGSGPFVRGQLPLRFVGQLPDGGLFDALGSVLLYSEHDLPEGTYPTPSVAPATDGGGGGGEIVEDDDEVDELPVGDPTIVSTEIIPPVCRDTSSSRISKPVTIRVQTSGVDGDETDVVAQYEYRTSTQGNAALQTGSIDMEYKGGGLFELNFLAPNDRYWHNNDPLKFTFSITQDGVTVSDSASQPTQNANNTAGCS